MKRNDIQALATKSQADLEKQLTELQDQLTDAYLKKTARKLKNVSVIKNIKADIARIKTVMRAQQKTKIN